MSSKRAVLALLVAGCDDTGGITDFERMLDQPKYEPYEACSLFADGRAMRTPPEGTVAHDEVVSDPALTEGVVDGRYVERFPIALSREMLARGRARFDTFCATCHGVRGDGVSRVAEMMDLRKPPSLISMEMRAYAPGRFYQTIAKGYGLMRPYTEELDLEERWAVVAYLGALQLSQAVALDDLPPDVRAETEGHLR